MAESDHEVLKVAHQHEMKYIQIHYKSKVGICGGCQNFSFVFSSQCFHDDDNFRTEVQFTKTFSYYTFRALEIFASKEREIKLEEYRDIAIFKQLCYAQNPNGETLLHSIRTNQESINYLFESINRISENEKMPFYIPLLEKSGKQPSCNIFTSLTKDIQYLKKQDKAEDLLKDL